MESDQTSILIIFIILGALFIGVRLKFKNEKFDEKSAGQLGPSLDDSLDQLAKNKKEEKKEALNEKKEEKKRKEFIQKKYKIIANFYNNYKIIDYTKKTSRKTAKKQLSDIVNILDENLSEMVEFFGYGEIDYKIVLVGIITFKHIKKETLNKVHLDLKKVYELGQEIDLGSELMGALERILYPFGLIE